MSVKSLASDASLAMIIGGIKSGVLLGRITLNKSIYDSPKRFIVSARVVGEWTDIFYCDEVYLDDEPIDYDEFQKIQAIDLGFVAKVVPENVEKVEHGSIMSTHIYHAQRVYVYTLPYLIEKTAVKSDEQNRKTKKPTKQASKTKKQKTA
ncbi:MAG: hypothetical protein JHC26_09725 [Thermofilum sp.]|jgi:hypothetical protein|uniref:hypothetical protein n=1 Tax=Thermofilum sp. TaxID=1961369 RepID=UPI0025853404|nr:hypothetical protein [Thermofilum sp.]MCI4409360.1 hypothetical protein [Thermofilum sp.]